LAIVKAGCAYVPLAPDYPQGRLDYMVSNAGLKTVITTSDLAGLFSGHEGQSVCLDDVGVQDALATHSPENLSLVVAPDALAYVLYTSGSTGQPKGVMVEHLAIVNRILWMHRQYRADNTDRILQKTPYTFDVSVWEFFWPISVGATLVIARPEGYKDPAYLARLIQDTGVTKMHFVPSMLQVMLSGNYLKDCETIRQVFCSGEALGVEQVRAFRQLYPQVALHNLYGPTEAAVDVSYWDCSQYQGEEKSIPIGAPIDNIQLYVLNNALSPVPVKGVGELYIGGVGLARGYINQ
ncbi:AMP-binding protein, partial [Planctobacterium marinum]|uniref:AMP-binding protein n=1 Tax=Planctobacterium marinum TaxID=1631968 RepID=UPI0036176FDD